MPTDANPLEITFPVKGVDVSTEFELQPTLTTPNGINVRAYEPLTQRGRGGARPGLTKYIEQQIPAGSFLIQHLNIVIDPTEEALLTTFDNFDPGGGVDDPSSNNAVPFGGLPRQPTPARRIRVGGSGIQPNRKIGGDQQSPGGGPTCPAFSRTYQFSIFADPGADPPGPAGTYCPCGKIDVTWGDVGNTIKLTNADELDIGYLNEKGRSVLGRGYDLYASQTDTDAGTCGPNN